MTKSSLHTAIIMSLALTLTLIVPLTSHAQSSTYNDNQIQTDKQVIIEQESLRLQEEIGTSTAQNYNYNSGHKFEYNAYNSNQYVGRQNLQNTNTQNYDAGHKFEHSTEDDAYIQSQTQEKTVVKTTKIVSQTNNDVNKLEQQLGWSTLATKQSYTYKHDWLMERVEQTSYHLSNKVSQARSEGKPYLVWVNIPSSTLRVIDTDSEQILLTSRVIIGAPHTQTPIFTTNITNLKFNPDWTPPPSLARRGSKYSPPGPNNPLGQVRFSTDNNQNIYLHDTNHPEFYGKKQRALSAGCIRVEKWHDMSQILSGMMPSQIDGLTDGNKIKFVDVPDSLVWISYERADLDEDGVLVLFPDIYGKQTAPRDLQIK